MFKRLLFIFAFVFLFLFIVLAIFIVNITGLVPLRWETLPTTPEKPILSPPETDEFNEDDFLIKFDECELAKKERKEKCDIFLSKYSGKCSFLNYFIKRDCFSIRDECDLSQEKVEEKC